MNPKIESIEVEIRAVVDHLYEIGYTLDYNIVEPVKEILRDVGYLYIDDLYLLSSSIMDYIYEIKY